MLVSDKINEIARLLYRRMGYLQKEGYNFEEATHPQEVMAWDMACIAWEEITGDSPDLGSDWNDGAT